MTLRLFSFDILIPLYVKRCRDFIILAQCFYPRTVTNFITNSRYIPSIIHIYIYAWFDQRSIRLYLWHEIMFWSIYSFIDHKNIIKKLPVHYGAAFMFESISYITLLVSSEREGNRKGHEVANIGRIQKNKRWTAASWSLCVVIGREVTKSGWLNCAVFQTEFFGPIVFITINLLSFRLVKIIMQ